VTRHSLACPTEFTKNCLTCTTHPAGGANIVSNVRRGGFLMRSLVHSKLQYRTVMLNVHEKLIAGSCSYSEGRRGRQRPVHLRRAVLTRCSIRTGSRMHTSVTAKSVSEKNANDRQSEPYRAAVRRSRWICCRRYLPSRCGP
jgi:hypothetical protein